MDGWMEEIFVGCFPLVSSGHQEVFIFRVGYPNLSLLLGVGASRNIMYIYINRCLRFDGFYLSHTYRWCFQTFLIFNPMLWGKWSKLTKKKDQMGWFNHQRLDLPFDSRIVSSPPAWPPETQIRALGSSPSYLDFQQLGAPNHMNTGNTLMVISFLPYVVGVDQLPIGNGHQPKN